MPYDKTHLSSARTLGERRPSGFQGPIFFFFFFKMENQLFTLLFPKVWKEAPSISKLLKDKENIILHQLNGVF